MGVYQKGPYPYPWNMPPQYGWPGGPGAWWQHEPALRDHGREPYVVNIAQAARQNRNFRTALWTGQHFQVTVMNIPVGGDIGMEVHPATDQFVRIEEGYGLVQMGPSRDRIEFEQMAGPGCAVMIPAGTWHNVTNVGHRPLKVYVIYAPPEHPFGTVHPTKPAGD